MYNALTAARPCVLMGGSGEPLQLPLMRLSAEDCAAWVAGGGDAGAAAGGAGGAGVKP